MTPENLLAFYKAVSNAIIDHLKITDPDKFTSILKNVLKAAVKDPKE